MSPGVNNRLVGDPRVRGHGMVLTSRFQTQLTHAARNRHSDVSAELIDRFCLWTAFKAGLLPPVVQPVIPGEHTRRIRAVPPEVIVDLVAELLAGPDITRETFHTIARIWPYVFDFIVFYYRQHDGNTVGVLRTALNDLFRENSWERIARMIEDANPLFPRELSVHHGLLTRRHVEETRAGLAASILDSFRQLQQVWTQERTQITRRWNTEISSETRLEVLRKAWHQAKDSRNGGRTYPEMASEHQPDLVAVMEDALFQLGNDVQYKIPSETRDGMNRDTAYKWPYLNTEDLSNQDNLLIFLYNRARYPPYRFIGLDNESWNIGYELGRVNCPPARGLMQFWGRETAAEYGAIVDIDISNIENISSPINGDIPATRGIVTMEIQQLTYLFALRVALIIAQWSNPDASVDQYSNIQAPQRSNIELYEEAFPRWPPTDLQTPGIADMRDIPMGYQLACESQYDIGSLDMDRIINDLLDPELKAAKRHLEYLLYQPDYFQTAYQQEMEHRYEVLPDEAGKECKFPGPVNMYQRAFRKMIVEALLDISRWEKIRDYVMELKPHTDDIMRRDLHESIRDDPSSGSSINLSEQIGEDDCTTGDEHKHGTKEIKTHLPMSDGVYKVFNQLFLMLENALNSKLANLELEVAGSKGIRKGYRRRGTQDAPGTIFEANNKQHFLTDHTKYFIHTLRALNIPRVKETIGMAPFAMKLETMMRNPDFKDLRSRKSYLSVLISRRVSTACALASIMQLLSRCHPYSLNFKYWRERTETWFQTNRFEGSGEIQYESHDPAEDLSNINDLEYLIMDTLNENDGPLFAHLRQFWPSLTEPEDEARYGRHKRAGGSGDTQYMRERHHALFNLWREVIRLFNESPYDIVDRLPISGSTEEDTRVEPQQRPVGEHLAMQDRIIAREPTDYQLRSVIRTYGDKGVKRVSDETLVAPINKKVRTTLGRIGHLDDNRISKKKLEQYTEARHSLPKRSWKVFRGLFGMLKDRPRHFSFAEFRAALQKLGFTIQSSTGKSYVLSHPAPDTLEVPVLRPGSTKIWEAEREGRVEGEGLRSLAYQLLTQYAFTEYDFTLDNDAEPEDSASNP